MDLVETAATAITAERISRALGSPSMSCQLKGRPRSFGKLPRRSSQLRWQRLRQKGQPQEFSCDLRFLPLWMLLPNPSLRQLAGEPAHLKHHKQPLLSRHCPLYSE